MIIKEQRSELVKHHLWVLWTDYFKPQHFEKYPQLHTCSTRPRSSPVPVARRAACDADVAEQLLAKIEEIAQIFWETKKA